MEHIVLRRIDDDWRILSVAVATPGRRRRPLKTSDGVALVGRAAKLLKSGGEAGEALAAVAELLRTGLQADRVMVWFRDTQTSGFRSVSAPLVDE